MGRGGGDGSICLCPCQRAVASEWNDIGMEDDKCVSDQTATWVSLQRNIKVTVPNANASSAAIDFTPHAPSAKRRIQWWTAVIFGLLIVALLTCTFIAQELRRRYCWQPPDKGPGRSAGLRVGPSTGPSAGRSRRLSFNVSGYLEATKTKRTVGPALPPLTYAPRPLALALRCREWIVTFVETDQGDGTSDLSATPSDRGPCFEALGRRDSVPWGVYLLL